MHGEPIRVGREYEQRLLCLTLARPKANIVDASMIEALQSALDQHLADPALLAVLIDAEGPHFSFGASVEEHLPAQCARMLGALHRLISTLVESPVPVLAAVRGRCLGGGFELVLGANLIFAAHDAVFGQPEIRLGVFAPAASCLLPERIAPGHAEDILFSGRDIDADTALAWSLVRELAESPLDAAHAYFARHLAAHSGFALRQAVKAACHDSRDRVRAGLARVERQYLDELMSGRDPVEGLNAFLDKRAANWEHR